MKASNVVPYDIDMSTNDSPRTDPLTHSYTQVNFAFGAKMYFMYDPGD